MLHLPYVSLLLAIIIAYTLHRLVRHRAQAKLARSLGCLPAQEYPHIDFLGYDLQRIRVDAVRRGRRNEADLELSEKYGPTFIERSNLQRIINTTETANFRAVGATQFDDFGRYLPAGLHPLLGHCGRHTLNGPAWRANRELIAPLFQRAEIQDVSRFTKHVDKLMSMLPSNGETFDLQPLVQKLFVDSATEFVFGESINCLEESNWKSHEFLEAFHRALSSGAKRMYAGKALSLLYMFDGYERDCALVHGYIDGLIQRHLERSAHADRGEKSDVTSRYVLINGMAPKIRDPVQLRFHLLSVFMPAEHAISTAVSNALFELARHPEIWADLQQEASKLENRQLTFESLKSLSLFRYTLFEAIRLHGPSGATKRTALKDTTLPRGGGPDGSAPIFVPKGTGIFLNNFARMRDTRIWGHDVTTFRPDRFEGKTLGWEFTPFFGGPRICPAINQVITQATYLLLRIVRAYDIENRDECLEYVAMTKINVQSKNGVKVALHHRQ